MLYHLYSGFRFLFEIACIIIAGCYGFGIKHPAIRVIAGILFPLIVIFVWGTWGAPAAPNHLTGIGKLLLEIGIYCVTAFFLYRMHLTKTSICFIIIGIINASINYQLLL